MKSFLTLAAAALIVCPASTALAQRARAQSPGVSNGSDQTGPSSGNSAGGAFTPLPISGNGGNSGGKAGGSNGGGNGGNAATVGAQVSSTTQTFTSGGAVRSPVTGQTIAPAAVQAVGALLSGGSTAAVNTALTGGGASPTLTSNLTAALSALSGAGGSPAAVMAAARAYNAIVNDPNTPASFLANPPADFVAIQAALAPMVAALGK